MTNTFFKWDINISAALKYNHGCINTSPNLIYEIPQLKSDSLQNLHLCYLTCVFPHKLTSYFLQSQEMMVNFLNQLRKQHNTKDLCFWNRLKLQYHFLKKQCSPHVYILLISCNRHEKYKFTKWNFCMHSMAQTL